jgi:hypothetical protein
MSAPKPGTHRSRPVSLLLGGAFIAAAIAVAVFIPSDEQTTAPYVTVIPTLDTTVETREFALEVTGVRLAGRVQTPEWIGDTNGVWLVVDVVFAPRLSTAGIDGTLRIGDRSYLTSRRPDAAAIDVSAIGDPGLPWAGSMLFELPESALRSGGSEAAVVQFAVGDTRLDGVLEYSVDLTDLPIHDSVTIFEPERVAP